MADIDLDTIIAQREEARAKDGANLYKFEFDDQVFEKTEGDTFSFRFKDKDWIVRDPQFLTDDEKDQLSPLRFDADVAAWYLGESQYDKFVEAGGESWMFLKAFTDYQKKVTEENQGNPTRPNRSSRRAQKRSKQR
ncbi:tail assembly chaperone [Gordonia phage Archimedes]|uniref:Tail assembly chaperone n=1 Tax=Gordonia phage Archimedes TaxID=2759389 RepID=A0A7L7SH05_9CAUD|nr:tail assembly chaperone [Gordonia phage Archimedes]QOC55712.1 tail assembly chaperone [Gordonia phage Archimedes]